MFSAKPNDPIAALSALFARLPGIGERTAMRLAFSCLDKDPEYARALARSLQGLHEQVRRCRLCANYGSGDICAICADPTRQGSTLCIVSRVPDLLAIERSQSFRGRYHVLHGLLSPLDGMGPDDMSLEPLLARIRQEGINEVEVATPLTVSGEATALYLAELLRPLDVDVSRIASGMPHGGELEYTDQVTLGRAFEGRRAL